MDFNPGDKWIRHIKQIILNRENWAAPKSKPKIHTYGRKQLKLETWKVWESTRPVTIYFKQPLLYKIHFLIKNGAPHPILSKIRLMDKIPRGVFFLLRTLTRRHIATVICLMHPALKFISHIYPLLVLSVM